MSVMTTAGTTIAISASTPATFDAAGFEALTFTQIGEVASIDGDIGRIYELVTWNSLAARGTVKRKGTYNSGSMTVPVAIDRDDAGQTLALAARDSDDVHSFLITLQDGTKLYFTGIVMGFPINAGGANAITQGVITVEITSDDEGNDFVEVEGS